MTLGNLQVAIDCDCGERAGTPESGGRVRCIGCGQYAERDRQYCLEHDMDKSKSPDGRCPYCAERDRVNRLEQERAARRSDPRMHPTVDAPRW